MKRLREWWVTRRHGPLTPDRCEVCKKPLRERERVEVMVGGPSFDGEYGGFTALLVAYCKRDAPEGAPT